jgi:hypothetical protein
MQEGHMMAHRRLRTLSLSLAVVASIVAGHGRETRAEQEVPLKIAKIYWEYNASADDLGVHVFLDGEDWRKIKIVNPKDRTIFAVEGKAGYRNLGLTELFFEGAEPSLADFPLAKLLALFPEGPYEFDGKTVDGAEIESIGTLSHAIPAGPSVSATIGSGDSLVIGWTPVTAPPPGFPAKPIDVVGYQVIVESFQVTVPAGARRVTVPAEFVASLASGPHAFEVLAIEASGNQTLTEGSFTKP